MNPIKRRLAAFCLCTALPGLAHAAFPTLDCIIEPHEIVEVSSAGEGVIEQVLVDRNDTVKKDQTLAVLQSGVERATVVLARERARITSEIAYRQVSLALSQRKQQRVDRLFENKAVSLQEKDELETDAALAAVKLTEARDKQRLARLELNRAQEVLKLRTVSSPIAGIVIVRYKSPGEYVDDEPLLQVAQLDPLRVEVIVPVTLFGSIHDGMQAEVLPESPRAEVKIATVTSVDRFVDAASGTFDVRLSLPNPNSEMPSGLKCEVQFIPEPSLELAAASGSLASNLPVRERRYEHGPSAHLTKPSVNGREHVPVAENLPEHGLSVAPAEPSVRGLALAAAVEESLPEHGLSVAPTEPSVNGSAQPELPICRSLGPLANEDQVDQLATLLGGDIVEARSRQVSRSTVLGYLVLAPTSGASADADRLSKALALKGIEDRILLRRGQYRGQISVGAYAYKKPAEIRRAQVAALGFNVAVKPHTDERPSIWVDLLLRDDRVSELTILEAVERLDQNLKVKLGSCNPASQLASRTSHATPSSTAEIGNFDDY